MTTLPVEIFYIYLLEKEHLYQGLLEKLENKKNNYVAPMFSIELLLPSHEILSYDDV